MGIKINKIAVLISGGGTNLQRIIDAIASKELPQVEIIKVIADRECTGLERAEKHKIPHILLEKNKEFYQNLMNAIPQDTDLIVLAGFLSILKTEFCEKWHRKIINIHPSLLPKYGGKGMWGANVHKAVITNHEKESGATVHYVTSGIDEGEIILQKSIKIMKGENADWLAVKVHQIEYEILIKAIKKVLNID